MMQATPLTVHPRPLATDYRFLKQRRTGPRPRTAVVVPHIQLDQWPPEELVRRLLEWGRKLPGVTVRESRMADSDVTALCVPDRLAHGPAEAFIDGPEFCHLHPAPHGSVHLTLAPSARQEALELAWGERHLLVRAGFFPDSLITLYAPRTEAELEVVKTLIEASCHFARGRY